MVVLRSPTALGCALAAAVRVFPSPAVPPQPCPGGGAGPSTMAAPPPAPAGHGATAQGEIRPAPGLSPASGGRERPEQRSPATGTRGSGTGVNGVTLAGKDQVLSGQPAAGRLNRGLSRAGHLLLKFWRRSGEQPRAPAGARTCGQEDVYLCSEPGSLRFPCRFHQSSLPSNL